MKRDRADTKTSIRFLLRSARNWKIIMLTFVSDSRLTPLAERESGHLSGL
jgi:hypothetical protein